MINMAKRREHDSPIVVVKSYDSAEQYLGAQIADKDRVYFYKGDVRRIEDWLEQHGYSWSREGSDYVWDGMGCTSYFVYEKPEMHETIDVLPEHLGVLLENPAVAQAGVIAL
jgi:hypothetical protein